MIAEKYHFIGIGGIGMSGLAKILLQRGKSVSGSDLAESLVTQGLRAAGATVYIGHREEYVPDGAIVVYNTDIAAENPELVEARRLSCQILHRSDVLNSLLQDHRVLAVTGTHGKTSTTALLTHVCIEAKLEPAFAVGGIVQSLQSNAAHGAGGYFIIESDESDGTILKYSYDAAIVTNIDTDHLAHFGTWQALVDAFSTFIRKAPNPDMLFYCIDDPQLNQMRPPGVSYGFSSQAALRGSHFRQEGWKIYFDITFEDQGLKKEFKDVEVNLTGKHNALNALAVFGLCYRLGIDEAAIRHGLASFQGVKRRLEQKADVKGVLFVDDYAHHPTEIAATLKAFRQAIGTRRLIALFQPHRYSRMRFVVDEIGAAFDAADCVIVTDLYTANEAPDPRVSTEILLEQIKKHFTHTVLYMPRKTLAQSVAAFVEPNDAIITLGAGDITKAAGEIVGCMENHGG